jgi:hypothetical protein
MYELCVFAARSSAFWTAPFIPRSGSVSTNCRYPADRVPLHTRFKSRQVVGRTSTHCHMPYGSGPRLPAEVDSGAGTCPMAPDLTSAEMGSDAATCPMAPDLNSRQRWAPMLSRVLWLRTLPPDRGGLRCYHMSYVFGPRLPAEVGSDVVMYPAVPCGPWASSIKKSLAVLPVQLGTHVSNARAQVSKAPARQRSQCLQGVQTGSYSATTIHRQQYEPLV